MPEQIVDIDQIAKPARQIAVLKSMGCAMQHHIRRRKHAEVRPCYRHRSRQQFFRVGMQPTGGR
jgi:hypothetical protein